MHSMWVLSKLKLSNFRSFQKECEFDFDNFSNDLILISSNAENSNGIGKTSLLLAVNAALKTCEVPQSLLKNFNAKSFYVELWLKKRNSSQKIKIVQNNHYFVEFFDDHNHTVFQASDATKFLLKTLQLNHIDLINKITYRPQQQLYFFLTSSDSDKKDFLIQLLNLEKFEKIFDNAKSLYEKTINELDKLSNSKIFLEQQLTQINNTINDLIFLKEKNQVLSSERDNLMNSFNINENKDFLNQKLNDLKQLELQHSQQQRFYLEKQQIIKNIDNLNEKIKKVQQNVCYACLQPLRDTTQIFEKCHSELLVLKNHLKNIENMERSFDLNLLKKINDLKGEIDSFKEKIIRTEMQLNNLNNLLKNNDLIIEKIKKNTEKLNTLQKDIEHVDLSLKQLRLNAEILEHIMRITSKKGFINAILAETLNEITHYVNEFLNSILFVNDFSVELINFAELKNKSLKQLIKINVYKKNVLMDFNLLSGGQKCIIGLAFTYAFFKIFQQKLNFLGDWLLLDEALDGLSAHNKKNALDVLKKLLPTTQILLVDHTTEVQNYTNNVILL